MTNTEQTPSQKSQRSPIRELLVVNDQLIREKYFADANDILKKIELLEIKIKTFHSDDQRKYDQWHQVTFRQDQEAVDQIQNELKSLARFHNWIVALAHQLDIEMHEAYALIKDEERRYASGTAGEKLQIEKDRRERDAFIESEIHSKYSEFQQDDTDRESEWERLSPLEQILNRLEDLMLKEDREPEKNVHRRMRRIMALSDDELEYHLRDQEIAFLLFDAALSWGEAEEDFQFFLKVWDLLSKQQKSTFSELYESLTGRSIQSLIARERRKNSNPDDAEDIEDDDSGDEDEFSFARESTSFRGPNREQRRAKMKPQDEEKLKGLYRKLIRKLHPDAQTEAAGENFGWIRRAWELVQKAYNAQDVKSLERLLKLTLLRTHSLDQLTIDEIQEARSWLQKDLDQVEREAASLKSSPAWGFSGKKSFGPLIQKIRRQFHQTVYSIQTQIEDLREQHDFFEALLNMESEIKSRPPSRPRKKAARAQRKRKSNKPLDAEGDDTQESFF